MSAVAPSEPLCINCNYPLAQLPDAKCPECGRAFDPADPSTFNPTRQAIGRLSRFALAAPVWPVLLIATVTFPWYFWKLREPHVSCNPPHLFEDVGLLLLTCLAVSIPRLLQLVLRLAIRDRFGAAAFLVHLRSRWPAWPFILTLLVIALMTLARQWPLTWAFNLSQPALDALADQALANPSSANTIAATKVGLFRIESVEVRGRQVILYTKTTFAWASWGLVRNPGCDKNTSILKLSDDDFLCLWRIKGDWYVLFPHGWS